jgi:hypothetical protein
MARYLFHYAQLRVDLRRNNFPGQKRLDTVGYGWIRLDTVRQRYGYGTVTVRLRLSAIIGRITVIGTWNYHWLLGLGLNIGFD